MAADSTLVNLSLKESLSRAQLNVPDLTPLYQGGLDTMSSYYKTVDTLFKGYIEQEQKMEVGKHKQLNLFQKTLTKQKEKLSDRGETMSQKVVDALDREIRRLQEEFMAVNTYGKDDTIENQRARTRLSAELVKVTNQAYNARQTFELLYEQRNSWIDGALETDVIAAQNKMMDVDIDNDDDVQVYFDTNGKLTFYARNFKKAYGRVRNPDPTSIVPFITEEYMTGEAAYTIDQMKENFPAFMQDKDTQILALVNDMEKEALESGKAGKQLNFNNEEVLQQLDIIIQTPEEFRSLGLRRVGMGGDNRNITLGRPSFLSQLKLSGEYGIQLELMDATFKDLFADMIIKYGEDGVIDASDLENAANPRLFRENYNKMISVLTNIKDKNFDLNRSKKLLISYFKNIIEEKYNTKHATGWDNDANPNKGMVNLFGKQVPKPRRKDMELEFIAAKAIEGGEKRVTVQGDIYELQQDGETYKLFKREGGGYAPYTEQELQQFGKVEFTRYELAKQLKYYKQYITTDYKFKKGR